MRGDALIEMPTDLRPHANMDPFELDQDISRPGRKGITKMTVDIPSSNRGQRPGETRPPSRWKSPEFALYYAVVLTMVPIMAWVPVGLSSRM